MVFVRIAILFSVLTQDALAYRAHEKLDLAADSNSSSSSGSLSSLTWEQATGEWVFYYKEWCPFTQEIFKMLDEHKAFEGFIKRVGTKNMKCFSSFEDVLAAQVGSFASHQFGAWIMKSTQGMIDPNDGSASVVGGPAIPCDSHFSKKEMGVHNEMTAAYQKSHDESCDRCWTYNGNRYCNSAATVPAIVINGVKYCETSELKAWFEKYVDHFKAANDATLEKGPSLS